MIQLVKLHSIILACLDLIRGYLITPELSMELLEDTHKGETDNRKTFSKV